MPALKLIPLAPKLLPAARNAIVPFGRALAPLVPKGPVPQNLIVPFTRVPKPPIGPGDLAAGAAALLFFAWGLLNHRPRPLGTRKPGDPFIDLPQAAFIQVQFRLWSNTAPVVNCQTGAPAWTDGGRDQLYGYSGMAQKILPVGPEEAVWLRECGDGGGGGVVFMGFRAEIDGLLSEPVGSNVNSGTSKSNVRSTTAENTKLEMVQARVNNQPFIPPTGPDPAFEPWPLPEIKPAAPVPLPPLPQPAPQPQPQEEPEAEPLPLPAPVPSPGTSPGTAQPSRPPLAPPVPQIRPSRPTGPDQPTQPDGRPQERPREQTRPRDVGVISVPGGEVGQEAARPRPDLVGIASELGRLEQKLEISLQLQQDGGGASEPNPLLEEIADLLKAAYPAGSFQLFPACDRDAQGEPLPPAVAPWPAGTGPLELLSRKVDALADLLQAHKDFRQPVCRSKPIGEEVTVTFEEVP